MPREFSRSDRVAEQLRRELAQLIRDEVKDPRVGMVTLGDVEVSKDLAYAKIFFTVFEDEKAGREAQVGLNRAAGFLRRQLSHIMRLRQVPELRFVFDETSIKGARLSALIDEAVRRDRQAHDDDPDPSND